MVEYHPNNSEQRSGAHRRAPVKGRRTGAQRLPNHAPQRPSIPGDSKRPVPNAEAARRAARSAMRREPERGRVNSDYAPREYESPLDKYYTAGIDKDYIDGLMDEEYQAPETLPPPLKIALIIGGSLLLLIAIFFAVRAILKPSESDVRLERRTLEQKRGVIETTPERTTAEKTTAETSEKATLPPLATDPYQNAPAWTPPTQEVVATPAPQPIAPPPLVNVATEPSEQPQYEPPQYEQPVYEEPVNENPSPLNPVDGGENYVDNSQKQPSPEADTANLQEHVALQLPAADANGIFKLPPANVGSSIKSTNSSLLMRPDVNGQYQLATLEGPYERAYTSADNSHIVTKTAEGQYFLHAPGQEAQELPIGAAFGLEKLVGNQGLAYLSGGLLYYMPYNTQQTVLISPATSAALMAEEAGQLLVVADDAVRIMTFRSMIEKELLPQRTATGNVRLNAFSPDGQMAIFQDEITTYLYLPRIYGDEVLRINKINGEESQIQYNYAQNEFLIHQNGSQEITRVSSNGAVERIAHPHWNFNDNSFFLSAGSEDGSSFGALAIYDNGNLYLSNSTSYSEQGNSPYYQASLLYNGISEVMTGGYGIYWTDAEGSLFTIDSRSDVTSENFVVNKIGVGGISKISANIDGSAIYYLKNGSLWQRRSGEVAVALANNVSDYISNPEGSKFYIITAEGGLMAYEGGVLNELAPEGSGVNMDSLRANPMTSAGGNTWIATSRISYVAGNQVLQE